MKATNPAAINPTYPWAAPGHAPIIDVCGYGGVAIPQGSGHRRGSQLPAKPRVQWTAGGQAEVAWSIYADHFGGYQYRLCPTGNAMTEDCFEAGALDFANKQIVPTSSSQEGLPLRRLLCLRHHHLLLQLSMHRPL